MELSETFYMGLYTFLGTFVLGMGAIFYKSKCDKVNVCWGALEIHRAVEIELQEDMRKMETFEDAKESEDV
jgi:hypothetical protein